MRLARVCVLEKGKDGECKIIRGPEERFFKSGRILEREMIRELGMDVDLEKIEIVICEYQNYG